MSGQKRVTVLGSSGGIGRSCADLFNIRGHRVTGVARTVAEGVSFKQVAIDLSDPKSEEALSKEIEKSDPDVLVFCTGQSLEDDITTVDISRSSQLLQVNALCVLPAIRRMVENPKVHCRSIVLISSVHARGKFDRLSYSMSKAALEAIMHSTSAELMKANIRINCIRPGPTETAMLKNAFPKGSVDEADYLKKIPSGRFSSPQEVAETVFFLAEDQSENITGQVISISGGF